MHFFEVWSWCGRLSVFSRSSVGKIRQGIREVKETSILIKRTFWWKYTKHYTIGGRAYPVRHYPIAVRLRDLAFDNKVALTVDLSTLGRLVPPLSPLAHEVRGDPMIYCAILCIASIPQSGDSSGAILGVRSVALLHLGLLSEVYI